MNKFGKKLQYSDLKEAFKEIEKGLDNESHEKLNDVIYAYECNLIQEFLNNKRYEEAIVIMVQMQRLNFITTLGINYSSSLVSSKTEFDKTLAIIEVME